jgi:cytoskeletal protein CcmA (bactofilin family)
MWRRLGLGALCGLAIGAAAAADADSLPGSTQRRLGGDLFIAGSSLTVDQPVSGDLIAMGGTIDVDAPVTGDAVVAGGKLRIGVDVAGSIYAAGGQLTLHGKVGRNLRAAGGQTELGARSDVGGNVSIAGGQVRLHGRIGGHVQAAGGRVFIDGPVGGDVLATSGHVELGPNARIAGKLRYSSGEALKRDPAAQVAGGVESLMPALGRSDDGRKPADRHDGPRFRAGGFGWVWTIGLVVLAAALLWALPRFYADVARTLRERLGLSVLLGFVLLVCTPVAALLALVTLIGIPLGLLLSALYLALLPVGYVSAGIGLGDWGLRRLMSDSAPSLGWRIAAAALALIVLALAGWVPWLGWLVAGAALLAGLGALVLQTRRLLPAAA